MTPPLDTPRDRGDDPGLDDQDDRDEADTDAAWFRPVWEDTPDEPSLPGQVPIGWPPSSSSTRAAPFDALALLAPLCTAQEALTRLDVRVEAAPAAVRDGLIARLAFREAAGMLAARHVSLHPRDLALCEAGLAGTLDLAGQASTREGSAGMDPDGPHADDVARGWGDTGHLPALIQGDAAIPAGLHLARLLRHLPRRHDPLTDPATTASLLSPLGPFAAGEWDAAAWQRWRLVAVPVAAPWRERVAPLPALLVAAEAARYWMEAGIPREPTAAQALAIATLHLARTGMPRIIPLPVWSAWPAIGRLQPGEALPVLRHRDHVGAPWEVRFLHLVAESALAGLRDLDRLVHAAAVGQALAAEQDRRSRLGDALEAMLRSPVLTAGALARKLRVTHQAAARLLAVLEKAGVVAEVTGRRSYRAFAVM